MNLVIDVGNTNTKIAVFKDNVIVLKRVVQSFDIQKTIREIGEVYLEVELAIISSVRNTDNKWLELVQKKYKVIVLDHQTPIPFKNCYSTPTTLGIDRIALISAAVAQFSNKNVLVIDAGTCITYDFKNEKEEYYGGAISPGIRLRYLGLNNYTAKLPLLDSKMPENITGRSTDEAIHSGVVFGIVHEIRGVIEEYCNIYSDLTVILTGGDADFLSKRLKNGIFATSNFLLEGLNHILAFNNR